jgi:hypothetical protein
MEMDDDEITKHEEYKAIAKKDKHGKLGTVDVTDLLVLKKALDNFDDMDYDIESAKKIMYKHIQEKYSEYTYTIANFGCSKLVKDTKDTLVLKLRDKTLRDNSYLFNTETGEVYFINELIMDNIPTSTCNNYNNVITKGIVKAQEHLDMVCFVMTMRQNDNETL